MVQYPECKQGANFRTANITSHLCAKFCQNVCSSFLFVRTILDVCSEVDGYVCTL